MKSLRTFSKMFLIVGLICTSLFVQYSNADKDIQNLVDAVFEIEFESGTELKLDITMDVKKITTDKTYLGSEISSVSEQELGAFRLKLYLMLESQLNEMFNFANLLNFSMPEFDGSGFKENMHVKLTTSFFKVNESINIDNFVNGLLDMGAVIDYTFNLKAEEGWNNTYNFVFPPDIIYNRTNTNIVKGNTIQWEVINGSGLQHNKLAEISLKYTNPTTKGISDEDIDIIFELDTRKFNQTRLTANIQVQNVDIMAYNILPDFVTNLNFVPADGIRLLIDNGLLSWDNFYNITILPVMENTLNAVTRSSFNQTIDALFLWDINSSLNCPDPYGPSNMDYDPPIRASLVDNDVNLKIFNISSRALIGLVQAGANATIAPSDINFGQGLENLFYDYSGIIYFPKSILLEGNNPYTWTKNNPITGEIVSNSSTKYESEEKRTVLTIDISNTDLNLLSFFVGRPDMNLGLSIDESQYYYVTKVPKEFLIPQKINLQYLSSDALRLCMEEVFDPNDISSFLQNENTLFENRIMNILQCGEIDGYINDGIFEESLIWDGNVMDMDKNKPVAIQSYAHISQAITFDISVLPPLMDISNMTLNFTGLCDQNVTYKILFPKGTSVMFADNLKKAVLRSTEDGRLYIEIRFDKSDSGLTEVLSFKMVPSILFIIGLFMPCIISLIITILLVVVVCLINKKRKGKKALTAETGDANSYAGQDYYIPPPPPKSR
ncbi:MAG: hypothetical protein JXA91_00150 [Candidatus Thermoplasmatota archaeon]|nr:hypothetical protein [Candidatus Thermoplasmatota archaeon]